ncbi:E3 ubiquitin-protein ligase TRIM71-like [Magallana gigas]|uniref:E3 ubiquitin-protein ligase TRIM71-like n=1 Tax=Magallana gigas TaxID=29159 RepID=UPI003342B12B
MHCAEAKIQCHLCETTDPPLHCDICDIYLCKKCVGEHFTDVSKEHKVVQIEQKGSTSICQKHFQNICYLFCEQCDIPICTLCVHAGEHLGHIQVNIKWKTIETLKEPLQRDLKELKESIYPKYKKIASGIPIQKAGLKENSQKFTSAIEQHGEKLHREIDDIISELKSDFLEMDSKCEDVLSKQEDEITRTISKIKQAIADLEIVINSDDVAIVSTYRSRNAEFRKLPPKLMVSLASFTPLEANKKQILKQLGYLSVLSFNKEEHGDIKDSPDDESSPLDRKLIDEPNIITDINAKHGDGELRGVACLTDAQIWTCGQDNILRLYSLQGGILRSIQTRSGNHPSDIAVTRNGELVYTDYIDRTINIVKNENVETLIRLVNWKPLRVCCTSSGELLVVVDSDDGKQTKVVSYIGSTEKQSIQYDESGKPLYSPGGMKYITENRNQDICVTDEKAQAVVVVNRAGKSRFTYTTLPNPPEGGFHPYGIATDSQSRILTAVYDTIFVRIHILDKDGQFLRYIDNCDLDVPSVLCTDGRDNLVVAASRTKNVKKVQYCM